MKQRGIRHLSVSLDATRQIIKRCICDGRYVVDETMLWLCRQFTKHMNCMFGIHRNADHSGIQTESQKNRLREWTSRESLIINILKPVMSGFVMGMFLPH